MDVIDAKTRAVTYWFVVRVVKGYLESELTSLEFVLTRIDPLGWGSGPCPPPPRMAAI